MYKIAAIAVVGIIGLAYYRPSADPAISAATQSVTLLEIQAKSEFAAISAPTQVIIDAEAKDTFGANKLLYIASVNVTAGIDLSKATLAEKLLQLPPPQILTAYVDVSRSRVYDHQQGLFAPNRATELQQKAQNDALTKGVEAVCENALLDRANEQAQSFFSGWLKPYGVSVKTTPPGDCVPPS